MFYLTGYRTMFRAFCIYDLLALGPLLIPVVNQQHIATLSFFAESLGGAAWQPFTPVSMLFVQMLGILGVGWAIWRWRAFTPEIGRFEGVLRLLFAATLTYGFFTLQQPLLLVFAAIDIVGGILHLQRPKSAG